MADFLLYTLNKRGNFSYVEKLGLDGPSDEIESVLLKAALHLNCFRIGKNLENREEKVKFPDFPMAAHSFVQMFRRGDLGKFFLDEIPPNFDKIS